MVKNIFCYRSTTKIHLSGFNLFQQSRNMVDFEERFEVWLLWANGDTKLGVGTMVTKYFLFAVW